MYKLIIEWGRLFGCCRHNFTASEIKYPFVVSFQNQLLLVLLLPSSSLSLSLLLYAKGDVNSEVGPYCFTSSRDIHIHNGV